MKKSSRQLDMCLELIDFKSQAWIWHLLIYGSWDATMEYREREWRVTRTGLLETHDPQRDHIREKGRAGRLKSKNPWIQRS